MNLKQAYSTPLPIKLLSVEEIEDVIINHASYLIGKVLEKEKKEVFIDKSPSYLLGRKVYKLKEWFPDAVFIHLLRDFRSVWFSYKYKFPGYFLIEKGVEYFCSIIKEAYDGKNKELMMNIPYVKYENFQSDFENEIKKVTEIIGLNFEKEIINYNNLNKHGIYTSWATETKREIEYINKELKHLLKRFNYEN